MLKEELAKSKLKKYGQEHITKEIENLSGKVKLELIDQILDIDMENVEFLYKKTKEKPNFENEEITPIDYINKEKIEPEYKTKLISIGESVIKNNQYAVLTMAGGQGTRLGYSGPKGTFKLQIGEKGKYIFEILAQTLEQSKDLYGVLPYWYIMTSIENNKQTIDFFEEHNYFGYEKEKVKFFKQGVLPQLTLDGKLVIENNKIKTASNGNGGVYLALKQENIIEDMKSKNIKWIYICGVDNIMVKPIDTLFIGLTINKNNKIASKSIVKAYPEEKVGVFCRRNGKPGIVEYIELTEQMRNLRNENNELVYGEGNFVSHLLSLDAIEKIADCKMEYHSAIKNNLYKFESFIFDGFKNFDDMLVMRVKREEEFAPIKNKEGVDSPSTAKEIYESYVKK